MPEPSVRAANLNFVPFCEKEYPIGSIAKAFAPVSKLLGEAITEYTCGEISPDFLKVTSAHLPAKLAETGVQALVLDTIHTFLQLVPMSMGIPYVHIWNVLHIDFSGSAPRIELLRRAALCITHAGLNTALESLAQGVPMVAIAIGYDQPGVAARIAYHRTGEFVEIANLTVERLSELIQRVRTNPSYRERARYFQKVIGQTHGLDLAADAIEQAFEKSQVAGLAGTELLHA